MRKRFLIFLSAFFILGLVAAAFAYNRVNNNSQNSAAPSCPMMQKQTTSASSAAEKDSCGMADCCKDGSCPMNGGACCKDKDSCPMKQKGESKSDVQMNMSKVTFAGGGDSCCAPGADCCKGGACCHKKS